MHDFEEIFLKWKKQAGKKRFRTVYHGDSRTTAWRRNQQKKARKDSIRNVPKISSFFNSSLIRQRLDDDEDQEENQSQKAEDVVTETRDIMSIEDAIQALSEITNMTPNAKQAKSSATISKFDLIRYRAVMSYLKLQQNFKCIGKMKASREVSIALFPKRSVNGISRRIREWAQQYLENQSLPEHRQERHVKTKSLIEDEDVQAACRSWLRLQRSDSITALSFSKWVCENISLAARLPRPNSFSERTATSWLSHLNYRFGEYRKGLYFDGHERHVVSYCNSFFERMEVRLPFIATFEGDDMSTMVMPKIADDQKRIVVVTHDESFFLFS